MEVLMEIVAITFSVFVAALVVIAWVDYITGYLPEEAQNRIRTFKEEAQNRIRTFKNLIKLAFLALQTDSKVFAVVFFSEAKAEHDVLFS
jgi:uncharacterized protein (DUF2236 family)